MDDLEKQQQLFANILEYLQDRVHTSSVLNDASVIEAGLEFLLQAEMPRLSEQLRRDLFVNGALQNFATKIKLLFVFGKIDEKLYNDLIVLKDIRNEFAHPKELLDFKHPSILKLVKNFKGYSPHKNALTFYREKYDAMRSQIDQLIRNGMLVAELRKATPDKKSKAINDPRKKNDG